MSKRPPKISLIIPVFNREHLVADTLDSIARQTASDFELILVDNNSTDGTYSVLDSWRLKLQANGIETTLIKCVTRGAAAARNAGLELAAGEWVMFFDSDDTMSPGHISSVLDAIGKRPQAEIIGWDVIYINIAGKRAVKTFARHGDQWHNLMHGGMATQRWCARTALVRSVGAWGEDVLFWDDIELGCRMLALKPDINYIGLSGVNVIAQLESITATYAGDPSRIEPALRSIERVLGQTLWTDLKRSVEYANTDRAGNPRGRRLMDDLLCRNSGPKKMLLRLAYCMTRRGIPGAARLAKPFCMLFR